MVGSQSLVCTAQFVLLRSFQTPRFAAGSFGIVPICWNSRSWISANAHMFLWRILVDLDSSRSVGEATGRLNTSRFQLYWQELRHLSGFDVLRMPNQILKGNEEPVDLRAFNFNVVTISYSTVHVSCCGNPNSYRSLLWKFFCQQRYKVCNSYAAVRSAWLIYIYMVPPGTYLFVLFSGIYGEYIYIYQGFFKLP